MYELIDPTKSVVFYVGKGKTDRAWKPIVMRSNRKLIASNPHKHNTILKIINEHKLPITVRIVSSFDDEKDAFAAEIRLIELYGRKCMGTGTLTNINEGGEGNKQPGFPVCQYTMWGEFITEYKNAAEACQINGYKNNSVITGCCRGKERSYKGFLWAYKGDNPTMLSKVKPVYQWDMSGMIVCIHRNCSTAAKQLGCDPSTISDNIKRYTRSACGFVWSHDAKFPGTRKDLKKKKVKHLNSNTVYDSVTEAARATRHGIGAVSSVCSGKRIQVGGDKFCYCE